MCTLYARDDAKKEKKNSYMYELLNAPARSTFFEGIHFLGQCTSKYRWHYAYLLLFTSQKVGMRLNYAISLSIHLRRDWPLNFERHRFRKGHFVNSLATLGISIAFAGVRYTCRISSSNEGSAFGPVIRTCTFLRV